MIPGGCDTRDPAGECRIARELPRRRGDAPGPRAPDGFRTRWDPLSPRRWVKAPAAVARVWLGWLAPRLVEAISGDWRRLVEDRAGIAVAQHRQHPGQGVGEETDVDQRHENHDGLGLVEDLNSSARSLRS